MSNIPAAGWEDTSTLGTSMETHQGRDKEPDNPQWNFQSTNINNVCFGGNQVNGPLIQVHSHRYFDNRPINIIVVLPSIPRAWDIDLDGLPNKIRVEPSRAPKTSGNADTSEACGV